MYAELTAPANRVTGELMIFDDDGKHFCLRAQCKGIIHAQNELNTHGFLTTGPWLRTDDGDAYVVEIKSY